jgi:hypothetical protein
VQQHSPLPLSSIILDMPWTSWLPEWSDAAWMDDWGFRCLKASMDAVRKVSNPRGLVDPIIGFVLIAKHHAIKSPIQVDDKVQQCLTGLLMHK